MEHGIKDALQRSLTSRQERSKLQDRLQSARKESETLREYSRRRFQTVVDWESRQIAPPAQITPRIQTSSRPKTTAGTRHIPPIQPLQTPCTPTNGPTKDGSILYNSKPFLLSSIRTRPNSEPPGRFDHLRGAHGKTYPYIQRTLEQSNCEYRVGATPCSTAREDRPEGVLSPDYVMLIPVTSEASHVTVDGDDAEEEALRWQKGQAWAEEAPLLASTARSRSPRSEERSESRMESEAHGDTGDEGRTVCCREGDLCGRQTPARENPTATTVPRTVPDNPVPPTSPRQPLPQQADPRSRQKTVSPEPAPTSTLNRPPSASSRPHSARSRASSLSSVSITPRPHCWVDDVTVSSDESLAEREASLQNEVDDRLSVHSQDPAARAQLLGAAAQIPRVSSPSGEKKKTMLIGKRVSSPLLKPSPSGGKAKAGGCPRSPKQSSASGSRAGARSHLGEREMLPMVKEGEDVGEEEVALPRFACPSSESKSRQAAIKEWLAKTSFATACRTVPLM